MYSLLRNYVLPPLIKTGAIVPVHPARAGVNHLLKFHDLDYLKVLRHGPPSLTLDGTPVTADRKNEILESFNLVDDCAVPSTEEGRFDLWNYVTAVAGASLHAASLLQNHSPPSSLPSDPPPKTVAINWGGGRHHAHRSAAGGFCYLNDTVLALQHMRRKFGKVLYLDVDIHHADGVEEAFRNTRQVVTVSFHKHGPGFFPGTGGGEECHGPRGEGGEFHTVNFVMPDGVTDGDFVPFYEVRVSGCITVPSPSRSSLPKPPPSH